MTAYYDTEYEDANQIPAGHALDGAEVLDLVHKTLKAYVVFPSAEAADAVTLYAAVTHAVTELDVAPRLVVKSPEKRCGKSRLLDVLVSLVRTPLPTANVSAAGLAWSITDDDPPTIVLDEADATFGQALRNDDKAEHLRGMLNAGFTRGRPYIRANAATRQVEKMPTFALAVLAGIGQMPDTIEDRAVIITLERKTDAEPVGRYRIRRDRPAVEAVGRQLAAWAEAMAEKIGIAEPEMPDGLNDRAEDVWEPLIAAADLAGGTWPERARKAAMKLATLAERDSAESALRLRLLRDLRVVFGDEDKLHTSTILTDLCKLPEAPWPDLRGRPLTDRGLSELLGHYGVRSCDVWIAGTTKKGYKRADLWAPWQRYLAADSGTPSARNARSANSQVSNARIDEQQTLGPLGIRPSSAPSGPSPAAAPSGPSLSGYPIREALTSQLAHLADLAPPPPDDDEWYGESE